MHREMIISSFFSEKKEKNIQSVEIDNYYYNNKILL